MKFNIMYFFRNLLTSLLVFIFVVNAIGVTQVSHICSMAASAKNWESADVTNCKAHTCCANNENASGKAPDSQDCCKDVVKYFQQNVNTTFNPVHKIFPVLAVISNFLCTEKLTDESKFASVLPAITFSPHETGKSILVDKQSFLI